MDIFYEKKSFEIYERDFRFDTIKAGHYAATCLQKKCRDAKKMGSPGKIRRISPLSTLSYPPTGSKVGTKCFLDCSQKCPFNQGLGDLNLKPSGL
jgi:hypothetical protein